MQNIRTIRYCFILFLSVLVSCKGQTDKLNDNCPLIPKPLSVDMQPGEFTFGDSVVIELKTDDEEIKSYLKELELDELLLLNDGIYTKLGEKGLKLSTGQKRRVNILRSYLMNKDIYILDEPTSNLDKHTEEVVVNFILKYFKNKTLIIATHNEKINEICNKFYYFENHNLYSKKLIVKN